jgi:ribonuclease VapC
MILDSSAIIAILNKEPEARRFVTLISSSSALFVSAATLVEASIVASRVAGAIGVEDVSKFLTRFGVTIAEVDEIQARLAVQAHLTFGKGRHPAKLNMGDCFVYSLAKQKSLPILFKGTDFAKTDALVA